MYKVFGDCAVKEGQGKQRLEDTEWKIKHGNNSESVSASNPNACVDVIQLCRQSQD